MSLPFSYNERAAFEAGFRVTEEGFCLNPRGVRIFGRLNGGYVEISLSANRRFRLHRLQAFQKFGEAIYEPGNVARHKDNNKLNNRADNILIGTQLENWNDIPEQSRVEWQEKATDGASRHPHVDIVEFFQMTRSYPKTMERFGITSTGTLHYILNKSRTAHRRAAA